MKEAGIYKILNITNAKFYIGSAKIFKRRFWYHRWCLENQKHQNSYLQRAWNKYGINAFEFHIIEVIKSPTKELLEAREQYYIDTLKPQYNLRKIANTNLGVKHSDQAKLKMSLANSGKRLSAETRKKISEAQIGRKASEETKARMSKSGKGRIHSEETCLKMSLSQKGRIPTQSQRNAVSEANKKRVGVKYNMNGKHYSVCQCEPCKKIRNERKRLTRKSRSKYKFVMLPNYKSEKVD